MAKIANPQGKGNHLLSNNWFPVFSPKAKSNEQIYSNYVLSMLVLSADFSFKPVIGTPYTLYLWKGILRLSLIPQQKCHMQDVEYLADCRLNADLTWQVKLKDRELYSAQADQWLSSFAQAMQDKLTNNQSFQDLLPWYEESLPFYRRLYASGLAKSLSISAAETGLLTSTPEPAQRQLQLQDWVSGR